MQQPPIPSANYHLWPHCNMRCRFCFATFNDVDGCLSRERSFDVVEAVAQYGFEKINFAGGEPTLCPYLPDLIAHAHDLGMTTSIVTNGSRLTERFLEAVKGQLDWVALSIDSCCEETNIRTGRACGGRALSAEYMIELSQRLAEARIRRKVNTVVCRENKDEILTGLIARIEPERWKVFQALAIRNQNDGVEPLCVSREEFGSYIERNRRTLPDGVEMIPEDNELMTGSYVMIDPLGRFFDDVLGEYTYSRPLLEVGVAQALSGVCVEHDTFRKRHGIYDWGRKNVLRKTTFANAWVG